MRAATGIEKNTPELISRAVQACITELVKKNSIDEAKIISIVFSQTKDITAKNPATALREIGYSDVPLFCTQEPEYDGSLPLTLRILVTYEAKSGRKPVPVYLGTAMALRPDLDG